MNKQQCIVIQAGRNLNVTGYPKTVLIYVFLTHETVAAT